MLAGVDKAHDIADPNLSVDQARAIFVGAGLKVDQANKWDWLSPPVSTFQVHDVMRNHVLLVQVYPNIAGAQRGIERMIDGYSASLAHSGPWGWVGREPGRCLKRTSHLHTS